MGRKTLYGSTWVFLVLVSTTFAQENQKNGSTNTTFDRNLISSTAWPWLSIGRVNLAIATQRSFCTGTLVASNKVLTAAHCLFDNRLKQWVKPDVVHFVTGVAPDAKYAEASAVLSYLISPGYKEIREGTEVDFKQHGGLLQSSETDNIANDWAILTLRQAFKAKPIPVYVISVEEKKRSIEAVLPGYGADRPYALSAAKNCQITLEPESIGPGSISAECKIAPGGSGSPILFLTGNEAKLIGIASSGMEMLPGLTNENVETRKTMFNVAIGASSSSFIKSLK